MRQPKSDGHHGEVEVIEEFGLPVFEALEARTLLSADVGAIPGIEDLAALMASPSYDAAPLITNSTVWGMTPAQIRHAYGFDQITFAGASGARITGDGSGQTIAIVDAYDEVNMLSDLKAFDAKFGIRDTDSTGASVLTKVMMASKMSTDAGWAMETALDVEWAHAMAPAAHILLVEAKSNSLTDLFAAVDYARSQSGVVSVSMSWGAGEFSSEALYDYHFTTPNGHVGGSKLAGGITFVAASGDSGKGTIWPAVSPNVVAVGGTTLNLSGSGYSSESAWSGSGGGISTYESKPTYEAGVTQSSNRRTSPDVSYDANPSSGFAVYDTVAYSGHTGWFQVGGTSAGAPQWAALMAIADQGRALLGQGSLNGFSQALPAIYALAATDFHDITSGSNGYAAAKGYDLATGRGSPYANLVAADLAKWAVPAKAATVSAATLTLSGAGTVGYKIGLDGPQAPAGAAVAPSADGSLAVKAASPLTPAQPAAAAAPTALGVADAILAASPAGQTDARQWAPAALDSGLSPQTPAVLTATTSSASGTDMADDMLAALKPLQLAFA